MSKRLLIRVLLIISFVIPLILSFSVWFSNRGFPTTPLFFKTLEFNYYIDVLLLIVFCASAVWFLLKDKGSGGLCFFLIYILLSVFDQTRIQPFFFEIAIIIFFYYLFRNNFNHFKMAFFLLMAGTYIWSGLHKANVVFYEFWFEGLNKRIPFIPVFFRQIFTWLVPFIEALFGVALLFNKTRKLGIYMLALMHAMVLITLIYSGVGFTVFPLNMINVVLLFMLYNGFDWNIFKLRNSKSIKIKIVAFYALILPALNLIGYYDHLLAFSYFSGKPSYCNIFFLNKEDKSKVPEKVQSIIREHEGRYYINVNEWSLVYVNLLCYPEDRVYLYLQDYLETFTGTKTTSLQYYKK
ncbi:MauE/DoxX family redox-associated membrane protein [Flavivirga spongiicola]|uniref:Methylamine utilisation protein MauE domain-containing protein n=1 Tax=Flavivirga spongiicola TaxID=421621 RepID=A0ABU7XN18_9FLAO|nr:MauE/DoxX family redox-associated membrane protein [Flavivirga sp. MEBiC05379]MDO5981804.1 hypothetical protein [Flavivirga sp. MEBiC05379]